MNWTKKDTLWKTELFIRVPGTRTLSRKRFDVLAPSDTEAETKAFRMLRHFEPDVSGELVLSLVEAAE